MTVVFYDSIVIEIDFCIWVKFNVFSKSLLSLLLLQSIIIVMVIVAK